MLQKSKSKRVWQLKYLLLLPLVVGMLIYTSLEAQENGISGEEQTAGEAELIKRVQSPQLNNLNQDQLDIPFSEVDKVPIFPGCEDGDNKRACFQQQMQKHISKNFRYPQEAQEKGIQGRVNILFIIQKDGSIGNVRMRSPDKILEAEAARIISLLPQMTPGEHHGEKVRVAYSVPITFKLEGKEVYGARRNDDGSLDVPFAIIEKVPVFPGCEDADNMRDCFNAMLQKHISKNFRYPKEAQEKDIQGRVNILFFIQEDGSIGNIKMRGPDKLLEDEAERIISLLPQMVPGEQGGVKVRVPFSIPINFRLKGPDENTALQSAESRSVSNLMSVMAYIKKVGAKEFLRCMVSDETKGLPGVNVSIQGKNETMVTDFDGIIEIEVQKGDVLIFQYKGLPTTMLTVTDQQKYQITNK
jgi:TonB family protein